MIATLFAMMETNPDVSGIEFNPSSFATAR
jgi:hypothetical protein